MNVILSNAHVILHASCSSSKLPGTFIAGLLANVLLQKQLSAGAEPVDIGVVKTPLLENDLVTVTQV